MCNRFSFIKYFFFFKILKNFANLWNQQNAAINLNVTQSFSVLLSPAKFSSVHSSSKIVKVSNLEWPRVLVWAKAFANESNPKLNQHQTIKLAKQMKEDGQLFVLKNIHGQTQAMGGFGRFTPNASVINMVYVPEEMRGKGFATNIILEMNFCFHPQKKPKKYFYQLFLKIRSTSWVLAQN
mgnify:CR=1 FL=1